MHEDLMLSRRQKTLSSISNYIPLHILLNEPAGITFSITVSKSWTIEQLARQIEAEYAYLVEREIPGGSNYPVIECGALFDHVDFKGSKRPSRGQSQRTLDPHQHQHPLHLQPQPQPPREQEQRVREQERGKDDPEQSLATATASTSSTTALVGMDRDQLVPQEDDHIFVDKDQDPGRHSDEDGDDQNLYEHDDHDDHDDHNDEIDDRTEAESRGVQLRFSDRIEDVLDRDSTVHVVNIDQGLGMGRKLSLTNLALAISHEATTSPDAHNPESSSPPTLSPSGAGVTRDTAAAPQSSKTPLFSRALSAHTEDHLSTLSSTPDQGSGIENSEISPTCRNGDMTPASLLWEQVVESAESESDTVQGQGQLQDSTISPVSGSFISSPFASSSSLAATAGGESPSLSAILGRLSTSSHCTTPTRLRSRATDILLNLESSSNDARFQEILHNTIALDHFRQFCFQEYSIENLLFWLDVELFSKGGDLNKPECDTTDQKPDRSRGGLTEGQFAVQHARYIYLTYIDSCGPLQVNLSDETRTEIPWPILDDDHYQPFFAQEIQSTSGTSTPRSSAPSSAVTSPMAPVTKKKSRSGSSRRAPGRAGSTTSRFSRQKKRQQEEDDALLGWPFDRHMFDGAQEHTYQLMKGHTLVRFEESDLWKAVLRIIHERPDDYAKATIKGPLSLYYKPDPSVILKTVSRSRSHHPSANLQTLYNWNNSTSDLDRSRDKEEALARTMSQYFGPIPLSVRHPGRITIVGLGREGMDDDLEEEEYFDSYDLVAPLDCGHLKNTPGGIGGDSLGASATPMTKDARKRSSSGSSEAGPRRSSRFVKRFSNGISGRSSASASKRHSIASDNPPSYYSMDQDPAHPGYHADSEVDDMTLDSFENGKRTTRWMVAGYFNDQVRLTAAQRKRLLRRNNKLTKFFGSRVDGTLRPVEERVEDQTPGQSSSQSAVLRATGAGPTTLAYALSSSTIQDIPLNGRRKYNKQQLQQQRRLKKSSSKVKHLSQPTTIRGGAGGGSESTSEVLLFIPDATSRTLPSPSTRSIGLLNKLKKYASADDYGPSEHSNGTDMTCGSGRSSSSSSHVRSLTASDAPSLASPVQPQRKRFAAHPHPLWSGSFSDQEGVAPTLFERRRGLSILSVIDPSLTVDSGISPTTPTSIAALGLHASPQAMAPELSVKSPTAFSTGGQQSFSIGRAIGHRSGSTLDRQAMLSRRKKADKLSTFFGAQLTAVELSSQLRMDCGDDELLISGPAATHSTTNAFSSFASRGLARSSTVDSHKIRAFPEATSILTSSSSLNTNRPVSAPAAPKSRGAATTAPLSVVGPTFSSVNQLSTKERTILWKRNKKLRELLGESLPESAVAVALTGPILFGGSTSSSSMGPRPTTSRTSAGSSRRTSVASVRHLPQIPTVGGGRRTNNSRVVANHQARRGSRSSRSSLAGLHRQMSTNSLDSILALENSMAAMVYRKRMKEQGGYENESAEDDEVAYDDDDDDDDDKYVSLKSPSTFARRRSSLRPVHRSTPSMSSTSSSLMLSRVSPPTISTSALHPFGPYSGSDRTASSSVPATPITPMTPVTASPTETMSRFRQKKRMDKIQQFLGDKVPEQDLWMGAVGRERTLAMLELDPLTFQSSCLASHPLSITTAASSKKMKILGKNRLGGLGETGGRTSPGALSAPAFTRSGSSKLFDRKPTNLPALVSTSSPPASTSMSAPASAVSSIPPVSTSPTCVGSPPLSRVKELFARSSEETIESLGISVADF